MIEFASTLTLVVLAAVAIWLDVSSRRLPNALSMVTAAAGLVATWQAGGWPLAGSAIIHAILALIAGMLLFRLGWLGGGDAKFYAACAMWFPMRLALPLLGVISLAGLVVVLVWIATRRLATRTVARQTPAFALVPYGIAIAIGAVAARTLFA